MKKILKSTLLITALSSSLMAEVVFNLGAQQFSNSVLKNYKDSTYNLEKSIASTGLAYIDGRYEPKEAKTGGLSVQIKEPNPHWGVSFSMYCYLNIDGCGVNLLGSNGHTINILIEKDVQIRVNGVTLDDGNGRAIYAATINGTIDGNGDDIEVNINGYKFTVNKPNFKLAHVDMSIASDGRINDTKTIDAIHSLAITSSKE